MFWSEFVVFLRKIHALRPPWTTVIFERSRISFRYCSKDNAPCRILFPYGRPQPCQAGSSNAGNSLKIMLFRTYEQPCVFDGKAKCLIIIIVPIRNARLFGTSDYESIKRFVSDHKHNLIPHPITNCESINRFVSDQKYDLITML